MQLMQIFLILRLIVRSLPCRFTKGFRNWKKDTKLNIKYGRLITLIVMAGYMSHEQGKAVDLTGAQTLKALETYVPLIQQGREAEVL